MTYFMSILMGIIQGVAEFLPISSSGHLALFQTFFGMENMEEKYMFFTVLLHFGTLISVCMVYWRDIVDMIREFSRSGTTISVGMMRGFDRAFAVRFSFLMSLPAVLGANVLEIKDALASNFPIEELPMYLVGVAVSAVVGYFAIRLVKSLSDKGKFGKFAYYCWAVGLGSLVAGIVKMMLLK